MTPICNLAVLGPTGSGKTAVAHRLADYYQADIVSCDSMQVYQDISVGTAKPDPEQLRRFNYHLIDMLALDEAWSVDRFLSRARPLIADLNKRGRSVLLVGGSGLYAKALLYDYHLQVADNRLYDELYRKAATPAGIVELRQELIRAAAGTHLPAALLNNPRRLVRAVEIIRLKGKLPLPEPIDMPREKTGFSQFIIMPPAREHRQIIRQRIKWMLEHGWIEETQALMQRDWQQTPTAGQVLGYREVAAYLTGRITSFAQLLERLEQKTWQYARRQRTWFRHQHPGALLLTLRPAVETESIVRAVTSTLNLT